MPLIFMEIINSNSNNIRHTEFMNDTVIVSATFCTPLYMDINYLQQIAATTNNSTQRAAKKKTWKKQNNSNK